MTIQLIETIAIVDGVIQNLYYHQQRYQQGMQYLSQSKNKFTLPKITIPFEFKKGIVRCRLSYDLRDYHYEFFYYHAKAIQSYQIVIDNKINYQYKYANRQAINHLLEQKRQCDDIIIIQNHQVTDSSIGNLLFLKEGCWFSPKTPLLAGTQRAKLLAEHRIQLLDITVDQMMEFERIMMINALNPFDEQRSISISLKSIRGLT